MKTKFNILVVFAALAAFLMVSCKNEPTFNSNNLPPADTEGILKEAADFPVGAGINTELMLNNSTYAEVVAREFDNVTFEYAMKQGSIVQTGGAFDYSTPDQLLQAVTDAGLKVHGHTLIWHQNNNGDYLRSLVGGGGSAPQNLLDNGDFESWSGGVPTGWTVLNSANGSFSQGGTIASNVHGGESSLKVEASTAGDNYLTQIESPTFGTTIGVTYRISFWIKASESGCKWQVEARSGATSYSGDQDTPTSWTPVSYEFEAEDSESSIAFDMGASPAGSTTYIDDVTIIEVEGSQPAAPQNVLSNGDFESWDDTSTPTGWTVFNNQDADDNVIGSFSQGGTISSNVHGGDYSLKVFLDKTVDNWRLQIGSPSFSTVSDKTYEVSFWIKATMPGCKWQIEARTDASNPSQNVVYSGPQDTPTNWTPASFTFTSVSTYDQSIIAFDMGASAAGSETYIDDVTITEVVVGEGGDGGEEARQDSAAVAGFMNDYITSTVSHYQGQVTGWDVVNEPVNGTGAIRTGASAEDTFYWGEYLGKEYIAMAFEYADAADPDALLYINEYNLESNQTKLTALVDLVNELLAAGVPIDGIGTEMHISRNTSYAGIDHAFQVLASTGLKVRVSELDVRINPGNSGTFTPTPLIQSYQQIMYNYVAWSYLQNVPADQRTGITVWNLTDDNSWIVRVQGENDYPTLFNSEYEKKRAYAGFLNGLKGNAPGK